MSTNLQSNLRIVVGKLETSAGHEETLASSDFDVRARGVEVTPTIEFDDENSKFANGRHTEDEAISGVQTGSIKFTVKDAWSGTVDTEPAYWKFLQACGGKVTNTSGTKTALTPEKSEDEKTITLWVVDIQRGGTPAAVAYKFAGCVGEASLACEGVGKPRVWTFEFQGKFTGTEDVANGDIYELTSPDTTVAEKLLSSPFSIGGTSMCISKFGLTFGNKIEPVYCQSESTGISHYAITARTPRFSCDPVASTVATFDPFTVAKDATIQALSLATASGTTPHFMLSMPRAQLLSPTLSAREGLVGFDLNYRLLENTSGSSSAEKERTWSIIHGASS